MPGGDDRQAGCAGFENGNGCPLGIAGSSLHGVLYETARPQHLLLDDGVGLQAEHGDCFAQTELLDESLAFAKERSVSDHPESRFGMRTMC